MPHGDVAQLGERGVRIAEVRGSSPLISRPAEVAEWQTRYVQGVVSLRAWGFKSPLRHRGWTEVSSLFAF